MYGQAFCAFVAVTLANWSLVEILSRFDIACLQRKSSSPACAAILIHIHMLTRTAVTLQKPYSAGRLGKWQLLRARGDPPVRWTASGEPRIYTSLRYCHCCRGLSHLPFIEKEGGRGPTVSVDSVSPSPYL